MNTLSVSTSGKLVSVERATIREQGLGVDVAAGRIPKQTDQDLREYDAKEHRKNRTRAVGDFLDDGTAKDHCCPRRLRSRLRPLRVLRSPGCRQPFAPRGRPLRPPVLLYTRRLSCLGTPAGAALSAGGSAASAAKGAVAGCGHGLAIASRW